MSTPKTCTHLSCLPYVPHAPPISFFLIWSQELYLVRSTDRNEGNKSSTLARPVISRNEYSGSHSISKTRSYSANNVYTCLYLLSVRTKVSEQYTFICHLLHVSAVFGNHQVDYTATYMEKNTDMDALFVKTMNKHSSIQQKWPTSLENPDVGKTGCSVPHGNIDNRMAFRRVAGN